jgi:hypothetical protein
MTLKERRKMMHYLKIMAVDPGSEESAFIIIHTEPRPKMVDVGIVDNIAMFGVINNFWKEDSFQTERDIESGQNSEWVHKQLLIEDIESFGMPVGYHVFQTVRWTGRFDREWWHLSNQGARYVKRSKIKQTLCGSARAKDSNIRQALLDIWGPVGTKKAPGLIYGVSKDMWSALAVATFYLMELDPFIGEKLEKLRVGVM